MNNITKYTSLILVNLIYALLSIFTKSAANYQFLSASYVLFFIGAILIMMIYAILWQQIIKYVPISEAYMFKGTSIVFVLFLSAVLFAEDITLQNIIGSVIIILGIALFAKSDKEVSK